MKYRAVDGLFVVSAYVWNGYGENELPADPVAKYPHGYNDEKVECDECGRLKEAHGIINSPEGHPLLVHPGSYIVTLNGVSWPELPGAFIGRYDPMPESYGFELERQGEDDLS